MQDLTPFLLKASLTNKDNKQITQRKLQTFDLAYIKTEEEVKILSFELSTPSSTDYAVFNGALATYNSVNFLNKPICWHWLRSSQDEQYIDYVDFNGNLQINCQHPNNYFTGAQINIRLDLKKLLNSFDINKLNIEKVCGENFCYHTLEFGYYPQSYVGDELNSKLFEALKQDKLTKTGKSYLGKLVDKSFTQNQEYLFNGERYVLVNILAYENKLFTFNEEKTDTFVPVAQNEKRWVKVEKIKWIIENFEDLPKKLNPNGTSSAEYISLRSESVLICGIPFNFSYEDKNCERWKFSLLRAYLNGLDMYKDKHDVSLSFIYDFTKSNFILEAFN